MSLALNKIILAGANANSAGAYFQTTTFSVVNTNSTLVTAGTYLISATANVNVEIQTASTGNTWATLYANGAGGMVISDGVNVRLTGTAGTTTKTVTAISVNPVANATGQYNT
jgi:hypothetical protein